MTATIANNVILSKGGTTVTIATRQDEENLTKGLVTFNAPTSTGNQSIATGPQNTRILDLLMKFEERITIDGELVTGISSGDTSNTADDMKTNLKEIFKAGGVIAMTYEGSTFNVNMDKLSIKRQYTGNIVAPDGVTGYSVKFTAVRGEDL